MSRLQWDQDGTRFYEHGVRKGVVYPKNGANNTYAKGAAWSGLRSVEESPEGGESNKKYANDEEYLNILSKEKFKGTIGAYTFPDEFLPCDGTLEVAEGMYATAQHRTPFGLVYRNTIGNDNGDEIAYKLHVAYNLTVSPSGKNHESDAEDIEADELSWEFDSVAVECPGAKNTAHYIIDSRGVSAAKMKELEDALYGVDAEEFSETKSYAVGDCVTHTDGTTEKTYRCITAVTTPGAWTAANWNEITNPNAHLLTPAEIIAILGPVTP